MRFLDSLMARFLPMGVLSGRKGVVLDTKYYTDIHGWNRDGGLSNTILGRGINMGNFLEAPFSEGGEGVYNDLRKIKKSDFRIIREAGFTTVRIPVRWSDYAAEKKPYSIDPGFIKRVRKVVDWALEHDLLVAINVHHYVEMMDCKDTHTLEYHQERLKEIWQQICTAFKIDDYPVEKIVFELLNEPYGRVGHTKWNKILRELTHIVWDQNKQPDRKVIIGTADWGKIHGLKKLELPVECNKNNTIISIHFYEPFYFTHQGAEWVQGSKKWIGAGWSGKSGQVCKIRKQLEVIKRWNSKPNRMFEIFIGEFGAYSLFTEEDHQKAWTAFLAREIEKRNFSWAYWEFCSGFGAYDMKKNKWRYHLLEALIPDHTGDRNYG